MRKRDIRFNGEAATLHHASARGHVTRNAGNFTRGSQLVTHEFMMTFAGFRVPFQTWFGPFVTILCALLFFGLQDHDIQLILMRVWSGLWTFVGGDSAHIITLTIPTGQQLHVPMGYVPHQVDVELAVSKAIKYVIGSTLMATFTAAPVIIWFVNFSHKRGKAVLQERHERGAWMSTFPVLLGAVKSLNVQEFRKECAAIQPAPLPPKALVAMTPVQRANKGVHTPYVIAGIPYPWRLEQSHTMLIGTTGTGKTTQLRSLVSQLRARGHRAVIFDLTGTFVESFYRPETDKILNPMDNRCTPWTIFHECQNYADFLSAATALIPSHPDEKEPFWQNAARVLFVEMCIKLAEDGETSNAAIAHHLMTADLKRIHEKLEGTVAGPLTTEKASKMAESVRSVLNVNGQALRFLTDPTPGDENAFSIRDWIARTDNESSILFITASYNDLDLTRGLMTLWMNLAVNSLMRLPKTRELRTWYLFDEVHALHVLPAIENGLQSARNYGGAFVLGIHSFDKLVATYGLQSATSLTGLARTKLILATADRTTAEKCSEFIGSREVREVDEAYSYGYNNTRDASTLTPRTTVKPLVLPDDITDLRSMHGFIKFPDGFPSAPITLTYRSYPEIARGFLPRRDFKPGKYIPPEERAGKRADDRGEGGRENTPTRPGVTAVADEKTRIQPAASGLSTERSEAEIAASAMNVPVQPGSSLPVPSTEPRSAAQDNPILARMHEGASDRGAAKSADQPTSGLRVQNSVHGRALESGQTARPTDGKTAVEIRKAAIEENRPEEQILRETREGAGTDVDHHHGHHQHGRSAEPGIDLDNDMDM